MKLLLACFVLGFAACEASELKVDVVASVDDCERRSKEGDLLSIHYAGKLAADGTEFDSSYGRGQPFVFQLGKKQVIPGWEKGTLDMCVGEKRQLYIPADLAYGEMGAGDRIPPKSDLMFDIELIKIEDSPAQVNVFKDIDADKDGQLSREEVGGYLKKQIPEDMQDNEEVANFDQDKMVEEIFQHEDKDKNGFISHDEFTGPKHDEL